MTLNNDYFDSTSVETFWTTTYDSTAYTLVSYTPDDSTATVNYIRLYTKEYTDTLPDNLNGMYQDSTSNFDIEIKIHPDSYLPEPTISTENNACGLLVKTDSNNFIFCGKNGNSIRWVYQYQYEDGGTYSGGASSVVSEQMLPPYYFRIKRVGNIFTSYFAGNDYNYYEGQSRELYENTTAQVWIVSHNTDSTENWMDIDFFRTVT
jgi:hypothetical protein